MASGGLINIDPEELTSWASGFGVASKCVDSALCGVSGLDSPSKSEAIRKYREAVESYVKLVKSYCSLLEKDRQEAISSIDAMAQTDSALAASFEAGYSNGSAPKYCKVK